MHRLLSILMLTALLAAPTLAADPQPSPAPMPIDLSGVWNLDTQRSDDLTSQLEALRKQRADDRRGGGMGHGPGGPGGPGQRGGRGGMGGRGGGSDLAAPQSPENEQRAGPNPRELVRSLSQLLITCRDGEVEIVDGADQTRRWTPDGEPRAERTTAGVATARAWWEGDVLCLERKGERRTVLQRLQLTEGGKTLTAAVTLTLPGDAVVRGTLVYRGA